VANSVLFRIGQGLDVHAFCEGDHLMLCGVRIPYHQGLEAHSDGDVAIHALCDAMLGAAALGDIGLHFPDTDPKFKDISSIKLLAETNAMVHREGFTIGNIDTIIFAEAPQIGPYRKMMQEKLASTVEVEPSCLNIKATTTEGLGIIGKGDGIGAMCVALLEKG